MLFKFHETIFILAGKAIWQLHRNSLFQENPICKAGPTLSKIQEKKK